MKRVSALAQLRNVMNLETYFMSTNQLERQHGTYGLTKQVFEMLRKESKNTLGVFPGDLYE